jgi:pyrroline-5-carboxylate reductase
MESCAVSVAAAYAQKASWAGSTDIERSCVALPNTPALIGAGITGLYASPEVGRLKKEKAETILAPVGEVVWMPEERAARPGDCGSASGPAYVFWFIEQLAASAEKLGIPEGRRR